jgi:site-specific recombinase XerD
MLETFLKSPTTRQRLRRGPAADYIDAFSDWLRFQGYALSTIECLLRSIAAWTDWMVVNSFTQRDFIPALEACKSAIQNRVRFSCGPNPSSISAARVFIRFLQRRGELPPPVSAASVIEHWPMLKQFRSWMREHRGLMESSLDTYQVVLVGLFETLGDDPRRYTAEALRRFVYDRAHFHGLWRANSIVVAVRSYLRFLGATKRCPLGMEHALPCFATRTIPSLPRFLAAEDVERVISSCDGHIFELRDKPVLLLLARLGLRASEVAQLKFTDIDWRNGSITVCGKGRRQESLPLPQEVGDAILLYLRKGRAPLAIPVIFTSVRAPFQAMSRATVTGVVRSALHRAGIKAPINGAHVLRHSAATTMLRCGASLAGVGAVLRHRSLSTTTHYAKVDFGLLSTIAQPWPEVPSC